MYTLEDRIIGCRLRTSGFDYMRVILAIGVITAHSSVLVYGETSASNLLVFKLRSILFGGIVPCFFALSGFLVAGSLERSKSIKMFFTLRVIRIAPALTVEVFVSALLLGPLVTTVSLDKYFSDPKFYSYFWNIVGHIHYFLPGVFETNPGNSLVNGQLWTVPYELWCYVAVGALAITGTFKRKFNVLLALIGYYALQTLNLIYLPHSEPGITGTTAVGAYVAGLVIFKYKKFLPWSIKAFALAFVISLVLLVIDYGVRFTPVPIAYLSAYLGLLNPKRNKFILSGDYSYGMYLYGYPIQQAIVYVLPNLREWYYNLIISMPIITFVAMISWWTIEKPALSLKRYLVKQTGGIAGTQSTSATGGLLKPE